MESKPRRFIALAVLALLVVGIACLVVGIVLISAVDNNCSKTVETPTSSTERTTSPGPEESECSPSEESTRTGFDQFLKKVQEANFDEYPYLYAGKKGITREEFISKFRAYNPLPKNIKRTTDKAKELLSELNSLGIRLDQLKPREKKAFSQVRHFLQHIFGVPYESNYYAGDFMLGPNSFCYQRICRIGYDIYNALGQVKPRTLSDMEIIEDILNMHKEGK